MSFLAGIFKWRSELTARGEGAVAVMAGSADVVDFSGQKPNLRAFFWIFRVEKKIYRIDENRSLGALLCNATSYCLTWTL